MDLLTIPKYNIDIVIGRFNNMKGFWILENYNIVEILQYEVANGIIMLTDNDKIIHVSDNGEDFVYAELAFINNETE